jgi:hypothetical protein
MPAFIILLLPIGVLALFTFAVWAIHTSKV